MNEEHTKFEDIQISCDKCLTTALQYVLRNILALACTEDFIQYLVLQDLVNTEVYCHSKFNNSGTVLLLHHHAESRCHRCRLSLTLQSGTRLRTG